MPRAHVDGQVCLIPFFNLCVCMKSGDHYNNSCDAVFLVEALDIAINESPLGPDSWRGVPKFAHKQLSLIEALFTSPGTQATGIIKPSQTRHQRRTVTTRMEMIGQL